MDSSLVPLSLSSNISTVRSTLNNLRLNCYPVAGEHKFEGLVYRDLIEHLPDTATLNEVHDSLLKVYAYPYEHIIDIMKKMDDSQCDFIPVIDPEQNIYIGGITLHNVFSKICKMNMIHDPGSIIVIESGVRDYHLSHIAAIIEDCKAKISGVFFNSHPDLSKVFLTIKVNVEDPSIIIKSLERHGINVVSHYIKDQSQDIIHRNYNYLMKYLEM